MACDCNIEGHWLHEGHRPSCWRQRALDAEAKLERTEKALESALEDCEDCQRFANLGYPCPSCEHARRIQRGEEMNP